MDLFHFALGCVNKFLHEWVLFVTSMCNDVGNMCGFMFHTYYIGCVASIFSVEWGNHIHWYMVLLIPFCLPSTSLLLYGLDHTLVIWHTTLRLNWGDSLMMLTFLWTSLVFYCTMLGHWPHSNFHPTCCQYSAFPPHVPFIVTMYTLESQLQHSLVKLLNIEGHYSIP